MTEQTVRNPNTFELFAQLIAENPNCQDIKTTIKTFTDRTEKLVFDALVGSEEEYLQTYGLTYHDEEHFNYINQILHIRTTEFLDRITKSIIEVKSTIPPPPPPPPQVPSEIVQQVQQVLNNIDLPLSLFKRNDNYWSQDNPKTVQIKQYIKQLHEHDRKWKGQLKKKRQEILNEKNQIFHKNNEETAKQEQKIKEQQKIRMLKNIQYIKSQAENRKKTISESLDFMKKQGRPLFKKMEEQFQNKVELPTLQEKKRKLSEVRELRRSVDLLQIQHHRQKYQKIKQEHEGVKIFNQPVKVAFKSNYHKTLEQSYVHQLTEDSRLKTLLDKRMDYSHMVKNNFKPAIDQDKASQITERIQLINKRFTRAKRNKKYAKSQDQDEEDEDEEQEPQPQPEQEQPQSQEYDSEDEIPKLKDDQYEPTHEERYKMGLKFLQEARKRRKKIQSEKPTSPSVEDTKNKTFTAKEALQSQQMSSQHQTIGLISNQIKHKHRYRNYLHEMSKTNKTIDYIDTSRIKKEFTHDLKLKNQTKMQDLQNKIRTVQAKTRHEEELLKHKPIKKSEALDKKQKLDNVMIDTIKARLALMKN